MPRKTRAETGRRHRYHPGTRALLEISYYQKCVGLICSKLAVSRIVREIAVNELGKSDIRFQASAIQAIHEGMEAYIIGLMEDTVLKAIHGCRVPIMCNGGNWGGLFFCLSSYSTNSLLTRVSSFGSDINSQSRVSSSQTHAISLKGG